jgi:hypothetical protein
MHAIIEEIGKAGIGVALAVGAMRALPALLAFYASTEPPTRQKALALFGYAALVFLAARFASFNALEILLAYAYLVPASAAPFLLAKRCQRPVLVAVAIGVFVVGPALVLPAHWLIPVLGWELAMASYSFGYDAKGSAFNARAYTFFLFVNPTLAYPARGVVRALPSFHGGGALRALGGLGALFGSGAINGIAPYLGWAFENATELTSVISRLASLYLAHTGLASLQIGLMRQLGYEVPERYDRVLSARSPAEFWTRWNTYVGTWARLYVFKPVVRALRRRGVARAATRAVAVVATFIAMGAWHDAYAFGQTRELHYAMTLWFAGSGVLLVVWHAAAAQLAAATKLGREPLALARAAAFACAVLASASVMP